MDKLQFLVLINVRDGLIGVTCGRQRNVSRGPAVRDPRSTSSSSYLHTSGMIVFSIDVKNVEIKIKKTFKNVNNVNKN